MPNHFHILIRPRSDDGLAKFMQKLSTGYTNYFNTKYKRTGALFGGKYKSIGVAKDEHLLHLPYYIHCNPLDLNSPEWRSREVKSSKKAIEFLKSYRWSSHLDYYGIKNFPSVTQRDFLLKFFGGSEGYKKDIDGWLRDFDPIIVEDVALE